MISPINFTFQNEKNPLQFCITVLKLQFKGAFPLAQIEIEIADRDSGLVLVSVQTNKNIFPSTS